MPPPELPGFYFDPAKKKYFKIESGANATTGAYTNSRIQQASSHAPKSKRRRKAAEAQLPPRMQRSRIMRTQSGLLLARSLATSVDASFYDNNRLFINELSCHHLPRPRGLDFRSLTAFEWEPSTSTLLLGSSINQFNHGCKVSCIRYQSLKDQEVSTPLHNEFARGQNPVSSISASKVHPALCITTYGNPGSLGTAACYEFFKDEEDQLVHSRNALVFPRLEDYWCSAAAPSAPKFAMGGTGRVTIGTLAESRWTESNALQELKGDVHSVAFLSDNIAAVGQRNGTVTLWDVRSQGTTRALVHNVGIGANAIRPTGATNDELIVAGSQIMRRYDLRMLKPHGPQGRYRWESNHNGWLPKAQPTTKPTMAVVEYDFRPPSGPHIGFDASFELNTVAAVDFRGDVAFLDALRGELIRKTTPTPADERLDANGTTVRFAEREHEGVVLLGMSFEKLFSFA